MVDPLGINVRERSDPSRTAFLNALSCAGLDLTPFEEAYVEVLLDRSIFSQKERTLIDALIKRYEHLII